MNKKKWKKILSISYETISDLAAITLTTFFLTISLLSWLLMIVYLLIYLNG